MTNSFALRKQVTESKNLQTSYFHSSYRMARSGISNDLWRGHSVELGVKSGPIISGLASSKIANALAWELNIRKQVHVPFAAIQYGLLSSHCLISDRTQILEAIATYLDNDICIHKIT